MKKILLAISLAFFASSAHARDLETFEEIYRQVQDNYIDEMDCETLAVAALKKINIIDKKLILANDNKRLSIYYDAALIKSYNKPDKRDVYGWADLSSQIIDESTERSKTISQNDFKITDIIMYHAFKELDFGSKYYPSLDIGLDKEAAKQAYFVERNLDGYLYLKLGNFNKGSFQSVVAAINRRPNTEGLIIDLRGNQGGLLNQAIEIAQLFLDEGIIASIQSRKEKSVSDFYMSTPGDILNNRPIIIMVDGDTASSAELLASSLQEQGRAVVFGTSTYGKGSVQNLVLLPNGSELALTNAEFLTPSGKVVDKIGLKPDVCAVKGKMCAKESRAAEEKDLDQALNLIKSY